MSELPLQQQDLAAFRVMATVALAENPSDSLAKNFLALLDHGAAGGDDREGGAGAGKIEIPWPQVVYNLLTAGCDPICHVYPHEHVDHCRKVAALKAASKALTDYEKGGLDRCEVHGHLVCEREAGHDGPCHVSAPAEGDDEDECAACGPGGDAAKGTCPVCGPTMHPVAPAMGWAGDWRKNIEFLAGRLVNVYGESPNTDYILSALELAGDRGMPRTPRTQDDIDMLLARSVVELDLSLASRKALDRGGWRTIGDLCRADTIAVGRAFGEHSVEELMVRLDALRLCVGTVPAPDAEEGR